ncbi:hypothetical protein AX16_004566 [Volvariella volvacea WC 439]|nr:hypothetical protein AX16_004566 [Volvariella volvacea WC 439]
MFEMMFGLPAPIEEVVQGTTTDNTIVLQDDPEDFRALWWVLYALTLLPSPTTNSWSLARLTFVDILELSVICDVRQLEDCVVAQWLNTIHGDRADVAFALSTAERLNMRRFQGLLYYKLLMKMFSSPVQQARTGHLAFSDLWSPA